MVYSRPFRHVLDMYSAIFQTYRKFRTCECWALLPTSFKYILGVCAKQTRDTDRAEKRCPSLITRTIRPLSTFIRRMTHGFISRWHVRDDGPPGDPIDNHLSESRNSYSDVSMPKSSHSLVNGINGSVGRNSVSTV